MKNFADHSVWTRVDGQHSLTMTGYIATITLSFGLALSAFFCTAITLEDLLKQNGYNIITILACLILGAVGMFIGSAVFQKSDDPTVSAIGVGVMAISTGVMVAPIFILVSSEIILMSAAITMVLFLGLSVGSIIASLYGALDTDDLGPILFQCLIALLFAGFAQIIARSFFGWTMPEFDSMFTTIKAWASILVFSGLIVYDWNQALKLQRSMDNAIDASGALFLDWINVFINVVQLYINKK
jgi:FtsH-binding integral membrane protein